MYTRKKRPFPDTGVCGGTWFFQFFDDKDSLQVPLLEVFILDYHQPSMGLRTTRPV